MARPRVPSRLWAGVAVGLLVTAGCSDEETADYDAAFQEDFLARCTEAFGRPGAPQVCGCWYDGLEATVAFEDLPSTDDLVADDFDIAPTRVPGGDLDEPLTLLADCVRRSGAAPTIGTVGAAADDPPATDHAPADHDRGAVTAGRER